MNKIIKNSLRVLSVITATGSVAMAAACGSNNNDGHVATQLKGTDKHESNFIDVYPNVFSEDFYPYIDFVNGQSHISDKMIAKLVKQVISDMAITDGTISWAYQRSDSNKTVDVSFKWEGSQETQSRTYQIKLNGL